MPLKRFASLPSGRRYGARRCRDRAAQRAVLMPRYAAEEAIDAAAEAPAFSLLMYSLMLFTAAPSFPVSH